MYEPTHPAYTALGNVGLEITQKALPSVPGGAKGVVVFSAHWQGGKSKVFVNVGEGEGLLYDFYGFPDVSFPCGGGGRGFRWDGYS